jgi:hypothetical protein
MGTKREAMGKKFDQLLKENRAKAGNADEFAQMMMKDLLGGLLEPTGKIVGRIGTDVLDGFAVFQAKEKRFTAKVDKRKDEMIAQMEKQLEEEFKSEAQELEDIQKGLWNQVYVACDIPATEQESHFSIDRRTGEVRKKD